MKASARERGMEQVVSIRCSQELLWIRDSTEGEGLGRGWFGEKIRQRNESERGMNQEASNRSSQELSWVRDGTAGIGSGTGQIRRRAIERICRGIGGMESISQELG